MGGEADRTTKRDQRNLGFVLVVGMVALMWILEIYDQAADANLDRFGIEPRETGGLDGILWAPFLHGGFDHLMSNTVPFVVMGLGIALAGVGRVLAVTLITMVVGGVGTWLVGPDHSIHIGASGVVFGYATYLIARGFFNKSALELLMGLIVGAVWGTALLSGLLPREGVSWQGHLFGAVGGVVAARVLATRGRRREPSGRPA
jgi:membrane associated rhomboid family serine protease